MEVHEEEDKFMRLLQLLGVWYEKGSVLIFVDKQVRRQRHYMMKCIHVLKYSTASAATFLNPA